MLEVISRKIQEGSAFRNFVSLRDHYTRTAPLSPPPPPNTLLSLAVFPCPRVGCNYKKKTCSRRVASKMWRQELSYPTSYETTHQQPDKNQGQKKLDQMIQRCSSCTVAWLHVLTCVYCTLSLIAWVGRYIWKNWIGDCHGVVPALAGSEW